MEKGIITSVERIMNMAKLESFRRVNARRPRASTTEAFLPFAGGGVCGKVKQWRHLIPLIAEASCVVTPDTGMGHIAAAFPRVPVVSLWGSFSHASRAKYYANHHPMEPKGICPHAPCWTHGNEIPRNLCKDCGGYSEQSTHCGVINSIDPDDLVAKVEEVAA